MGDQTLAYETFGEICIPKVAFLENDPRTIVSELQVVNKLQAHAVVLPTVSELVAFLTSHRNVLLYCDMHMPDVGEDFRQIGLHVETEQGSAVAIAVIKGLLVHLNLTHMKARVLTGYPLADNHIRAIAYAKEQGRNIESLRKGNLDKFEEDVKLFLDQSPYDVHMRKISAAIKIVEEWSEPGNFQVPLVFGYSQMPKQEWQNVAYEVVEHMSRDIEERVDSVLLIKQGLRSLFGSQASIGKEKAWLREPDPNLNDQTPWGMMISRDQRELLRVSNLIRRLVQ